MQLVWQQFACMKAAIVFLCRSVCVCVCVCVCVFGAGKSPSREASALKRPSVEAAYTSSVRFLHAHKRIGTQTHLYVWLHQGTPLHGDTAAKRPTGWCGKSKLGANENVRMHYQTNQQTTLRHVEARAHGSHTHHSAVSRWSTRAWWEQQKSTVYFLSHVERSYPQLELNLNTFFIHRPGFTANSNTRSAHNV